MFCKNKIRADGLLTAWCLRPRIPFEWVRERHISDNRPERVLRWGIATERRLETWLEPMESFEPIADGMLALGPESAIAEAETGFDVVVEIAASADRLR